MDLGPHIDTLRRELLTAARSGGDQTRAVAEHLLAPLDSAVRLTLLEVLSVAADEITRELTPGSVHLRLRGRNPDFVVSTPPVEATVTGTVTGTTTPAAGPVGTGPADPGDGATDGATARINFRPPEAVKVRIEEAAAREGLSVNAWLVRLVSAALDAGERRDRRPPTASTGRFTGWVG